MKFFIQVLFAVVIVSSAGVSSAGGYDLPLIKDHKILFKNHKIVECCIFPIVQPKFINHYIFGNTEPSVSPITGRKMAKIVASEDLEIIRESMVQGKLHDRDHSKKYIEYEILFLFENRTFLSANLTIEDDVAHIRFYGRTKNEKDRHDFLLSSKAYKIIIDNLVKLTK